MTVSIQSSTVIGLVLKSPKLVAVDFQGLPVTLNLWMTEAVFPNYGFIRSFNNNEIKFKLGDSVSIEQLTGKNPQMSPPKWVVYSLPDSKQNSGLA